MLIGIEKGGNKAINFKDLFSWDLAPLHMIPRDLWDMHSITDELFLKRVGFCVYVQLQVSCQTYKEVWRSIHSVLPHTNPENNSTYLLVFFCSLSHICKCSGATYSLVLWVSYLAVLYIQCGAWNCTRSLSYWTIIWQLSL